MVHHPIQKNEQEKKDAFQKAFLRLVRANTNYDEGDYSQAGAIAINVFALVFDNGKSQTAALTIIGQKNRLLFIDTNNKSSGIIPALTKMVLSNEGMKHGPAFESKSMGTTQSFDNWWTAEVLSMPKGDAFSRENLILYFRHGDGAHISVSYRTQGKQKGDSFAKLARGGSEHGIFVDKDGNETIPTYGPEYATVRQIGWEVEQTIRRNLPDFIIADDAEFPMKPVK